MSITRRVFLRNSALAVGISEELTTNAHGGFCIPGINWKAARLVAGIGRMLMHNSGSLAR